MSNWRKRARRVIFEADTPGGRTFDVILLVLIVASVLLVMVESMSEIRTRYAGYLSALEWVVTILFSIEYVARLITAKSASRYARSFFGVIDFLSILPVYLSVIIPGAQPLLVVRSLRLLRVFRVFKMAQWLREANYLMRAVRNSTQKVMVFLLTVLLINIIVGSTMYVIEGAGNGFDSMFRGVYWSIVTMSTVGFGDIAPQTGLGQVLAALLMILGYSVIAVPTGIVSAEISGARQPLAAQTTTPPACGTCGFDQHDAAAGFCQKCGAQLTPAANR